VVDELDMSNQINEEYILIALGSEARMCLAPRDLESAFLSDFSDRLFLKEKEGYRFDIESLIIDDKSAVLRFLGDHSYLNDLLTEALFEITKYFPSSALNLEVMTDPDSDVEIYSPGKGNAELVLSILTTLEVRESIEKRNKFDRDWWVKNIRRAKGKLCITIDYI
jgi:hypothetical protein